MEFSSQIELILQVLMQLVTMRNLEALSSNLHTTKCINPISLAIFWLFVFLCKVRIFIWPEAQGYEGNIFATGNFSYLFYMDGHACRFLRWE